MRPARPGGPYVSTMEFDSAEDFRAWMKSDSFKAAHSDVDAPGMQAPSAIELFDVLEDFSA
ncbi:antibiotic biosynthesis monooxygenase family protein [Nonomuraea fuscirosea]|uniref:antibiotic biosynthesis monooxygenase family protein n=1 Tax=Nonomuraea fuscirosea TaxID=1291556 RepID=UPI003447C8C5